jgi:hypothetical protein
MRVVYAHVYIDNYTVSNTQGAECVIISNPLLKPIDEDERYERVVVITRTAIELIHEVVHATTQTIPKASMCTPAGACAH